MTRTARPTLRVIREDLRDGWDNPYPRQAIENGAPEEILPLTSLGHPILVKATESFGENPTEDSPVGTIAAASSQVLYEVKVNQWRAGVWIDEHEVCWVIAAGLAKGGHKDHDDFYERIQRIESRNSLPDLLPTPTDEELWTIERSHALLDAWHMETQRIATDALVGVASGGRLRFTVPAPAVAAERGRPETLAEVDLIVERFREPDYTAEEVVLTIHEQIGWKGSPLASALALSLLAMVHPPETDWDIGGGSYSNMLEVGTLERRIAELREMSRTGRRATSEPCLESHYVHQKNLAARTLNGKVTRAICGAYFVPRHDHEQLPVCQQCAAAYAEARS